MVTGRSPISRKIPTKSCRCIGRIFASAARRPSTVSARIISRTARMRFSSKNMCSVRQSPIPSAPKTTATRASVGVSALARTPRRRRLSAHFRIRSKERKTADCSGLSVFSSATCRTSDGRVGSGPRMTSPVVPSIEIQSPSEALRPFARTSRRASSTVISPAPTTQVLPMPRATTAAWDVAPPRVVRIPAAACMPAMSSGEVSSRTRTTGFPSAAIATARAAVRAIRPDAAPGPAGRPLPSRRLAFIAAPFSFRSKTGARSCTSCSGSTRERASSSVIRPSSTISVAMRAAANPVRFPLRVWSRYRRRSSIVNSRSCMSRKRFSSRSRTRWSSW